MGGNIFDWLMDHILPWVILLALAALAVITPLALYASFKAGKTPTMTLRKSEWACTQTQTIPVTTYVMSGKVMVPITTYTHECQQWNRQ
jgi:hypothetical protein